MATFGIETENNLGVKIVLEQSNKNLQNQVAFKGKIKQFKDGFAVINMDYLIPNIPLYLTLLFGVSWLMLKWAGFAIAFFPFFFASLLWTDVFFFLVLRLKLRKSGYKGRIKLLSSRETIKRMLNGSM